MRRRLRGELRGIQQNGDPGRSGQSGEVRLAVVIEVGRDQPRWTVSHTESDRRLKRPVALAEQNGYMTRLRVGVVGNRQIGYAVAIEIRRQDPARIIAGMVNLGRRES